GRERATSARCQGAESWGRSLGTGSDHPAHRLPDRAPAHGSATPRALPLRTWPGVAGGRSPLDGAGLPSIAADVGAAARGAPAAPEPRAVTAPLAMAVLLAAVCGVAAAGLYLAWPRRLTAEEWVLHRRAMSAPPIPRVRVSPSRKALPTPPD